MNDRPHATLDELESGLGRILASPVDEGRLVLISRRPRPGEREVVEDAELHLDEGLIGDNWKTRGSRRTDDGSANPGMQLNLMNSRAIELIARDRSRWALAGDQLYVDLNLGEGHLPAGTRLTLGTAVIEITAEPHLGCKKFEARFGLDALKFVNGRDRRCLRLRGVNAKIVRPGLIRVGDTIRKVVEDRSATHTSDGVDLDKGAHG